MSYRWLPIALLFAITSACAAVEPAPVPEDTPWQPLDHDALQELVGPIALYPDDLVAIVLPASTLPLQVVQAARFRQNNTGGEPDARWDDSVVALLNYPEVLKQMNDDLDWTWQLGEAVVNQQQAVIDAIAEFRERARTAGNLRSDDKQIVEVRDRVVTIRPVNERIIYVPYYDPFEVTRFHTGIVYNYYPSAYPVYYYPYDTDFVFSTGFFWGVSTWFGVGWHLHALNVLPWYYRAHPYYGRTYHRRARDYYRMPERPRHAPPSRVINDHHRYRADNRWQPAARHGSRPLGRRDGLATPWRETRPQVRENARGTGNRHRDATDREGRHDSRASGNAPSSGSLDRNRDRIRDDRPDRSGSGRSGAARQDRTRASGTDAAAGSGASIARDRSYSGGWRQGERLQRAAPSDAETAESPRSRQDHQRGTADTSAPPASRTWRGSSRPPATPDPSAERARAADAASQRRAAIDEALRRARPQNANPPAEDRARWRAPQVDAERARTSPAPAAADPRWRAPPQPVRPSPGEPASPRASGHDRRPVMESPRGRGLGREERR